MLSPNNTLQNGRYRILRRIGQGGMGAVYEAYDNRLKIRVALKEALVTDTRLLRAFEREAQRLARLRHSALPNVIDHFVEGQGQYLVMEYIEGQDLKEALTQRGRPFPVATVMVWADQLLDALTYMHSRQPPVIHRDIKPANLKVTPEGQIILLDFGLAKGGLSQLAPSDSLHGATLRYAPLEQIAGQSTDSRSDLYALGATLYHLLTAQPPENALQRHVEGPHSDPLRPANQLNAQIPAHVANALTRAMALDAAQRPASATAMRAMLAHPPAAVRTPIPNRHLTFSNHSQAQTGPDVAQTFSVVSASDHRSSSIDSPWRQKLVLLTSVLLLLAVVGSLVALGIAYLRQTPDERAANPPATAAIATQPMTEVAVVPNNPTTPLPPTVTLPPEQPTATAQLPPTAPVPSPPTPTITWSPDEATATIPTTAVRAYVPTLTPEPPEPTEAPLIPPPAALRVGNGPDLRAPRRTFEVTLDGIISEWDSATPASISNVVYKPENWSGPEDLSGIVYATWDEQYLYLAIRATDDAIVQESQDRLLHRGDAVELFWDIDLAGDFAEQTYNDDDAQMDFSPGDVDTPPSSWVKFSPTGNFRDQIAIGALESLDGYEIEVRIPWSGLGITPQTGQVYGYAVALSDDDEFGVGEQQTQMSTSPRVPYPNPHHWGNFFLDP